MGALETLYGLIYGKSPDDLGESDLLGAPDRLKLYALQKLLQGKNASDDYTGWINDLDADQRARENPSYDERYLNPEIQKRIEYGRKRLAEKRGAGKTASGGVASGGTPPPASVVNAERLGEAADETGASPYKAASKPTFDYGSFSSALQRYVSASEEEEAARLAQQRADSVRIDVPGGYQGLERIRQQAGGTIGGGTFSAMEANVTGGDTEEDLRRYVAEHEFKAVDRQIDLIERAFPVANRPPALDARLQNLYEARANRDQQETLRQGLPMEAARAEADLIQARGSYAYNTGMPEATAYGHELDYRTALSKQDAASRDANSLPFIEMAKDLIQKSDTLPNARPAAAEIWKIGISDLPQEEKWRALSEVLQRYGLADGATLSGANLAAAGGDDLLDAMLGPRPAGR